MSGCNYESECPVCGSPMNCWQDHKPFDQVTGVCLVCGFEFYTSTSRLTLESINNARELYNSDFNHKSDDPEFLQPIHQSDYTKHTKAYEEL
jgi:hypothetical protein